MVFDAAHTALDLRNELWVLVRGDDRFEHLVYPLNMNEVVRLALSE